MLQFYVQITPIIEISSGFKYLLMEFSSFPYLLQFKSKADVMLQYETQLETTEVR